MQWWLIVVIVVCVILVAIVSTLVLDKYRRRRYEHLQRVVEMIPLEEKIGWKTFNNTLIVYLPGIVADADMIAPRVLNAWAKHGEVWGVNYIPPRFMPNRIVSRVSSWVASRCQEDDSVHNVVFIGSSMGGLLASDVLRELKRYGYMSSINTYIMPVDAPTQRKDLWMSSVVWVVRGLPFGPLWNHLSWLLMKFLVIPPKKKETDTDVDPDWLARQVAGARSFPVSFWRDQIMYILNHGVPRPESITSPMAYIRSTKDNEVVKYSAARQWLNAAPFGQWFEFEAEGAKHAAYAQNPAAYEKVFPEAFKALGL